MCIVRVSVNSRRYPPGFPAGYQGPKEASDAEIGRLILRIKTSQSAVRVLTKVSRDFDVIQPISGPLPDCFLVDFTKLSYAAITSLSHSKIYISEGDVIELGRVVKSQSTRFFYF
jgi:hypothetical protein